MKIHFSNIVPLPIPQHDVDMSEVWNKDVVFADGGRYVLCAASGKGKSTFVNIIFGLRHDFSGQLYIDESNSRTLSRNDVAMLRRTRLSLVPQGLQLFANLTVNENIDIKNRITGYLTTQQIAEMLDQLDVGRYAHRKACTLSFGQQQRVAIVRAMCQPFDYLLMDEPFSHLDADNTNRAMKLVIDEVQRRNAGLIITSLTDNVGEQLPKIKL